MQTSEIKRRESIFIIFLILLLAAVIVISRYAFGINLDLFNQGFNSMGYQEVKADGMWAVSFTAFSGEVSEDLVFPAGSGHRLRVRLGAESGLLKFALETSDGNRIFSTGEDSYDFLDLLEPVRICIIGDNVLNGHFSAIWD